MKPSPFHLAVLLAFIFTMAGSVMGADRVAEFSSHHEGWTLVSHSRENPPWLASGITAQELSPAVGNGFLRVQDLNDDWQCIAAPASFLGDWQGLSSVRLGLVTDDAPTVFEVVLFLSGSLDGVKTNGALFRFPIAGTPSSSRFDLVAPLQADQWTVQSGSWNDLMKNVQQFWIRMDLNNNVAGELDLLDYVRLADSGDLSLKIHRAVELEFFAVAGVTHQIQVSNDLQKWKNFGFPFLGDGTQQSRWVRLGDQEEQYFRVIRVP